MMDKTEEDDGVAKTIQATVAEDTTLPSDLTLVYSYSSDNGTTYTHILPAHPGTYTVKVESGNSNYALTSTTSTTLTISAPSGETEVSEMTAVTAPDSFVYDSTAKEYSAAYEGISEWKYVYYDSDSTKLEPTPVNAGSSIL